jgi:hypothetical protein
MPFNVKTFQTNAESWLDGPARDELVRACETYPSLTTGRQKARCIRGMMDVLDRSLDEATRQRIMEACGRCCIPASTLKKACRLRQQAQGLDDLLARLNAAHIGGGHLQRNGNVILATYDRCYCGSVSAARPPFSATYCQCSCGWYRQLFETLLERPVEVVLLGSIIQGDDRCRFLIRALQPG